MENNQRDPIVEALMLVEDCAAKLGAKLLILDKVQQGHHMFSALPEPGKPDHLAGLLDCTAQALLEQIEGDEPDALEVIHSIDRYIAINRPQKIRKKS